MKKILTVLIAASAFMIMASAAQAADYTNDAGEEIVITCSNVNGAPATMNFNPSPQILLQMNVGALRFVTTAGHTGAYNVEGGKEYAAAYDSTKIFFMDIYTVTNPTLFTLTASSSLDMSTQTTLWFY